MTTLYVHIGIPKSGTTSLQDNLANDPRINYIQTFYFHKSTYWRVRDFTLRENAVNVLSNETFSVRGERSGKVPLRCILQRITNEGVDVKLLLTIRNQLTSLSSMFRFRISGGNTFTSFGEWLMQDEGMDFFAANLYGVLIRSILPFIPNDNIKVLFFEELATNPHHFYSELFDFMGIPLELDRIDCHRHVNKSPPCEQVYARNIANRYIGTRNRLTRRLNAITVRVLKAAVRNKVPSDFFSLESIDCYDRVLAEIGSSNRLLLDYYPELEPALRKYEYPL